MAENEYTSSRASDYFRKAERDPRVREVTADLASRLAVGRNILRERLKRGWTQADLAEEAGMSQPRIAELEGARKDPKVSTIDRVATALGTTAASLLMEDRELAYRDVGRRFADMRTVAEASTGKMLIFDLDEATESVDAMGTLRSHIHRTAMASIISYGAGFGCARKGWRERHIAVR